MRTVALLVTVALALTALPPAGAWVTPGLNLSLERVVPEPLETNDYISYAEARGYLDTLANMAPERIEVLELGPSYGWDNPLTGARDTWPVLAVEVTNEASPTPRAAKQAVLFQLSIHGNEKGGREGGLRAIEDLVRGLGMGAAYAELLDDVIVVFTFPNIDGWMHEELPYRLACPGYVAVPLPTGDCVETQSYVRYNGHGQDLNRDWPTRGWYQTGGGREHALSEPEMAANAAYLAQFKGRTVGAADIHGMLVPADASPGSPSPEVLCSPATPFGSGCVHEGHFVLGMTGFNTADPEVNLRTVRIAERTKEYLNAMAEERFPYWTTLPNLGAVGGTFSAWGTGWDSIGYTDSGSTSRWYPEGLDAPGATYEMSYNHVTFDNHYLAELNAIHVESVRAIVRGYLDEALQTVRPALLPAGPIAYLADDRVVAGDPAQQEGPHRGNASDDAFEAPYTATAQRFWRDLARYAPAGAVAPLGAADLAAGRLAAGATLVVAGDAWDLVAADAAALRAVRAHLDQGGRVVLTDSALRGLEALGLAPAGSVEEGHAYLGYVDLDPAHPLAAGVRGLARQTYDGVALGYPLPQGNEGEPAAPVWTVQADAVEGLDVAGTSLAGDRASLGRVAAGAGEVVFLGAVLPTPSQQAYHPYGLADHAVTYTGYQLLYNALGIEVQETEAEVAAPTAGSGEAPRPVPGLGALAALAALGALALGLRRRGA